MLKNYNSRKQADNEAALPVECGLSPRTPQFFQRRSQTQTGLPDSLHHSYLSLAILIVMANQSSLCLSKCKFKMWETSSLVCVGENEEGGKEIYWGRPCIVYCVFGQSSHPPPDMYASSLQLKFLWHSFSPDIFSLSVIGRPVLFSPPPLLARLHNLFYEPFHRAHKSPEGPHKHKLSLLLTQTHTCRMTYQLWQGCSCEALVNAKLFTGNLQETGNITWLKQENCSNSPVVWRAIIHKSSSSQTECYIFGLLLCLSAHCIFFFILCPQPQAESIYV